MQFLVKKMQFNFILTHSQPPFCFSFFQERLLKEATETMLKETTEKKDTLPKTNGDTIKTFTSPEISKAREPVNELKSPQLTSPSFVKKKAIQEPAKVGKVVEPKETTKLNLKALVNKNVTDLKAGEVKQVEIQRSSNPFAKSSKNQETGSLLDSLKMLKKNESPSNK